MKKRFARKDLSMTMTVAVSGWSLGLFAAGNVLNLSVLSLFGLEIQLACIFMTVSIWLGLSLLLSWQYKLEMSQVREVAVNAFLPLLLLLCLRSASMNIFLGLQRPVLMAIVFLTVWIVFRSFVRLKVPLPDILIGGAWGLLLVGLVGLFFWRILLLSPLHTGSIDEDFLLFFPLKDFAATMLRSGVVPLWNPYIFSGVPFMADSQVAVFHPVTLLLALLVRDGSLSYRAGELAVVVQFAVAIIGMYLFARSIKLERWSAAIAAIVFTFGGFMVSHVRHLPIINVAPWLPWALWTVERFSINKRVGWQIGTAIFLLIAFLGGHLQTVLYVFSFVAVYAGWRLFSDLRSPDASLGRKAYLGFAAILPFPASLLLGAWQLFPTLELLPLSTRSVDVSYHLTTEFSLELQNLITAIAPNFMGGIYGRYWGPWSYWWEFGVYIGVFTLIMVAFAVWRRRKPSDDFFFFTGGISLFLALGVNTVLQTIFYLFWPGFNLNRAPARFLMIFTFCAAILCARGIEYLIETRAENTDKTTKGVRGSLIFAGMLAVFIPFLYSGILAAGKRATVEYFANSLESIVWAIILLALSAGLLYLFKTDLHNNALIALIILFIVFDLFSSWRNWFVERDNPESFYVNDQIVEFIKKDRGLFRVEDRDVWPPNAGDKFRIQTVGGSNTLSLADYGSIAGIRDLLNIKYIISRKSIEAKGFTKIRRLDGVSIYQNDRLTPRAFLVGSAEIVSDRNAILDNFKNQDISVRDIVYLEDNEASELVEKLPGTGIDYSLTFSKYQPNYMEIKVSNNQPGFLVLSEMHYPGWIAMVDNKAVDIYRADYSLRAVWLDKGQHQVTMEYRPSSFLLGLRIALSTGILLLLLLGVEIYYLRKVDKRKRVNNQSRM